MEFKNIKSINLKNSSTTCVLIVESEDGKTYTFKPIDDDTTKSEKREAFRDIMSSIESIGTELLNSALNVTLDASEKMSEVKTKFLKNIKKWVDEELKEK